MERLRRFSWFERIRTGPSPEDDDLLQITRELAQLFQIRFWYKQILWGKFDRGGTGWMLSKPVLFSGGVFPWPGSMPEAELMLPEYLKGKLQLDTWKSLIALHLARFKAFNSGRFSKMMGVMILIVIAAFIPALILQLIVGGFLGPLVLFSAWSPGFLLGFLYTRSGLRTWEFELDREVADKLGEEPILRALEQMRSLDPRANPSTRFGKFLAYWNPSITDRISELGNPRPSSLPRSSRIPRIGLRGRAIMVGIGFAIFWTSGFAASLLYSEGRSSFACTSNGCAALVMSAALGYWLAILAGLTLAIGVVQWFRRARLKKTIV